MRTRLIWLIGLSAIFPGRLSAAPKSPIEVKVEVTEVDQTKAASLGIEWIDAVGLQEHSPAGVASVGRIDRVTQLRADVHFLIEEGAAELLANPNLITDSGTAAMFHAGGEIPYVTNSSLGASHVEFKPYGVALNVRPLILENGMIQMRVKASMSEPDTTNGVVVSGNTVPALAEREVTSNVTVSPGATMTLAGLVQSHKTEITRGVPLLRSIPFVGALFRWKKTALRRTTIVVFVTPRVVEL